MPWIKKCNRCGAELGEIEPEAMDNLIRKTASAMLLDPRCKVNTISAWCAACDPKGENIEPTTFMMKKGDA